MTTLQQGPVQETRPTDGDPDDAIQRHQPDEDRPDMTLVTTATAWWVYQGLRILARIELPDPAEEHAA